MRRSDSDVEADVTQRVTGVRNPEGVWGARHEKLAYIKLSQGSAIIAMPDNTPMKKQPINP